MLFKLEVLQDATQIIFETLVRCPQIISGIRREVLTCESICGLKTSFLHTALPAKLVIPTLTCPYWRQLLSLKLSSHFHLSSSESMSRPIPSFGTIQFPPDPRSFNLEARGICSEAKQQALDSPINQPARESGPWWMQKWRSSPGKTLFPFHNEVLILCSSSTIFSGPSQRWCSIVSPLLCLSPLRHAHWEIKKEEIMFPDDL